MLMKSSGFLHEAVRGPFLYASISLAYFTYFEAEKGFILSILKLSEKYTMLIKKNVLCDKKIS